MAGFHLFGLFEMQSWIQLGIDSDGWIFLATNPLKSEESAESAHERHIRQDRFHYLYSDELLDGCSNPHSRASSPLNTRDGRRTSGGILPRIASISGH